MSDEPERVDPTGIPEFTGNLEQLERDHAALTSSAGSVRDIGATVHNRFQGLSAFYDTPEAEQLFATTVPVRDRADTFAGDLESVASTLATYASEVRPLIDRLRSLKAEATEFVAGLDDDWRYDGDKVDRNNDLVRDISETVARFWEAERSAANAITALVGGTRWTTDDGSGGENMYGLSVEDMRQAGETPWGRAVEEKHHAWEVWHHVKSFVWDGVIVDGIWGTLTGLATLVNPWSDNFGAAWRGLGQLATGLAILSLGPGAMAATQLLPEGSGIRQWVDDSMATTVQVGKSLVAWDEWSENPARAAGLVTFNVVTTVATLGTGTAVRGTGTAARAATTVARVGNAIDPMTYISRGIAAGAGALPRLGSIIPDLSSIRALELPDGMLRLPDGQLVPPTGPLPENITTPIGLPDGTIRFPDGTTLHPSGQLDLPDGQPLQTPDHIPVELSAARQPELATIGAHTSGAGSALGDNLLDGSRLGSDLPPAGGADHLGRDLLPADRDPSLVPGDSDAFAPDWTSDTSGPQDAAVHAGADDLGGDVIESADSDVTSGVDELGSAEGADLDSERAASGDAPVDGDSAVAEWFDKRGNTPPRPQTYPLGPDHPGFSMMAERDPFYRNSLRVQPLEGHYDVVAHGDPHQAYMHAADGRKISPRDLANILRNQADYTPGTPVRMLACNTGHADGTFARRLAQHLQAPVIAPDGYLYNNHRGWLGVDRNLSYSVSPSQVRELPNTFHRYHPDGRVEELDRSEWAVD
ncbi:hypothetical protein [Streptomyces sp. URMC 129]|uniref:hypothetical protein n=1 Tax=Streptomyces sp. URMC 129 TaxID=3423407 RepID=UPI003F1CE54C